MTEDFQGCRLTALPMRGANGRWAVSVKIERDFAGRVDRRSGALMAADSDLGQIP